MILLIDNATSSLYYTQGTTLEGTDYTLEFFWSEREGAWYMNIYDANSVQLAMGVRLVVDWPLLRRYVTTDLPPGLLFLNDTSGQGLDIQDPSDLGSRCQLTYITSDEFDAGGILAGLNPRNPV